jgi:hypothetical protein
MPAGRNGTIGRLAEMMTQPTGSQMNSHDLLLAMAGRVPDRVLATARRRFASGTDEAAITLLADTLAQAPIPLTEAELTSLRSLAGDAGALPDARPAAAPPGLRFVFGPYDETGVAGRDALDDALVEAAPTLGGALSGIWRSWRYPGLELSVSDQDPVIDSRDDPLSAYRVYLIQVDDPAEIRAVAAGLSRVIGEPAEAGIEIIGIDQEPPAYQRAALAESLLLWARPGLPEFQVARVFDFADPRTGPGFEPDHRVIDDSGETRRLSGYLRGGYPALTTTTTMLDVVDPASGAVVPASFRTDGSWIWTDSVTYYLDRYGLAPDTRLTRHIEAQFARGVEIPDVDPEAAIDAAHFLLNPAAASEQAAVWYPSGGQPQR